MLTGSHIHVRQVDYASGRRDPCTSRRLAEMHTVGILGHAGIPDKFCMVHPRYSTPSVSQLFAVVARPPFLLLELPLKAHLLNIFLKSVISSYEIPST